MNFATKCVPGNILVHGERPRNVVSRIISFIDINEKLINCIDVWFLSSYVSVTVSVICQHPASPFPSVPFPSVTTRCRLSPNVSVLSVRPPAHPRPCHNKDCYYDNQRNAPNTTNKELTNTLLDSTLVVIVNLSLTEWCRCSELDGRRGDVTTATPVWHHHGAHCIK